MGKKSLYVTRERILGTDTMPATTTPPSSPGRGEEDQAINNVSKVSGPYKTEEEEDEGYLGFSQPFSIDWCFSVIGSEYCHTYLWIAKDLAWTQGWRLFSISAGSLAIMWWTILLHHALRLRNVDEVWNCIGLFLWLFANFWWMAGEAHDFAYPDSPAVAERHNDESAYMLEAATVWLSIYYFVVVPTAGTITKDPKAISEYDDGEFRPRFSYFKNFRQYENVHTLFWLAKDLAWNRNNISMWFVMLFPTVLVAADLLFVSIMGKNTIIDLAHYAAGLLWVLGNAVWALGEFFSDSDEPFKLWDFTSSEARTTARWYSSWILIGAFLPVLVLYSFWIPLTIMGKIPKPKPQPPRRVSVRRKRRSSSTGTSSGSYQGGSPDMTRSGSDGSLHSLRTASAHFVDPSGEVNEASSLLAAYNNNTGAEGDLF